MTIEISQNDLLIAFAAQGVEAAHLRTEVRKLQEALQATAAELKRVTAMVPMQPDAAPEPSIRLVGAPDPASTDGSGAPD